MVVEKSVRITERFFDNRFMSTEIALGLTNDIAEKLSEIAKETERSQSSHIQIVLDLYLTEMADWQVAYDRLHDTTDPVISIKYMKKELEL